MIGRLLPQMMAAPLFGDRKTFGLVPDEADPDWQEWQKEYLNFYQSNQKQGLGKTINDAGYQILKQIDLSGKSIAEIGPGGMHHMPFWNGVPALFTAFDIEPRFLAETEAKMTCPYQGVLLDGRSAALPVADDSFDILLTFYSLEHLHPLDEFLDDYRRVLKPGGLLVGAVPNEGGLAWGLGRFLTSRRWVHQHTSINYDKIICWEHPNFVDTIINGLEQRFDRRRLGQYPLRILIYDMNLVTSFVYKKP